MIIIIIMFYIEVSGAAFGEQCLSSERTNGPSRPESGNSCTDN